jgi:hypothetical protein
MDVRQHGSTLPRRYLQYCLSNRKEGLIVGLAHWKTFGSRRGRRQSCCIPGKNSELAVETARHLSHRPCSIRVLAAADRLLQLVEEDKPAFLQPETSSLKLLYQFGRRTDSDLVRLVVTCQGSS